MSKDIERYKREHFLCVSHTIETETVHEIGQREREKNGTRERDGKNHNITTECT